MQSADQQQGAGSGCGRCGGREKLEGGAAGASAVVQNSIVTELQGTGAGQREVQVRTTTVRES